MKLSVIIPVYNEEATVLEVIEKVESIDLDMEIIVINDCSTDGTRKLLEGLEAMVIALRFFCDQLGTRSLFRCFRRDVRTQLYEICRLLHRTKMHSGEVLAKYAESE